jgi:hypothetical protein
LCGLFLLSPGLAAVGLPQLAANLLSSFPSMTDPRYHSVDAIAPFLIGATVLGIARLPESRRLAAASAILVTSSMIGIAVGPWPRLVGAAPLGGRPSYSAEHVATVRAALALVPNDAAVVSTTDVGAHLSSRRYVYTVPVVGRSTWAIVDLEDPWTTRPDSPLLHRDPVRVRRFARHLEHDTSWERVFDRRGVLVFRRSG